MADARFSAIGHDCNQPRKVSFMNGRISSQALAVERTLLAHERTLMAWVRTSTSLISFGFTIYKFFAYLVQTEGLTSHRTLAGPRHFALAMISLGVISLAFAVAQERRAFKLLQS